MGRLLLVDLGEDEDRFEQFMLPLASNIYSLIYNLCIFFKFNSFSYRCI
jgi:hypothetical protein